MVYSLLLQMALPYLLSLVCTLCCDSAINVTFTNSFELSSISGMHVML